MAGFDCRRALSLGGKKNFRAAPQRFPAAILAAIGEAFVYPGATLATTGNHL